MVSVLETMSNMQAGPAGQSISAWLQRWVLAKGLRLARQVKSRLPGSHNKPEYQLHRYPVLPLEDLRNRIARFQELLGYKKDFRVEPVSDVMFRIEA